MKIKSYLLNLMVAGSLAVATLLAAPDLHAQTKEAAAAPGAPKRPKICLVLSGGGARGAAHVGVLKVLEELRVPIHCITGTSMGALVGGAYATGTTLPEMDVILKEITTELLFKENPPREELSMRRKADDLRLFFGPEIGVGSNIRGAVGLPKGVVTGVQLETVLRRLAKTPGYYQFDKLPIPYRAVATDLVTGKAVVFKDGELANVMRASMSVPGAVAPAEFGGMMLVDGMLTSNLPVAEARAMGADVIIAVNVGTPLLKREELNSILGVSGQMLSILTEQNVQASLASLKPTDILISPELGDFSTGDFDNLPKISPLGEAAARKVADRLAQLAIPEKEYLALRQRQQVEIVADLRPVDEIRFENLQRVNPKTVEAVMDTKAGQPIDQKKLDNDMRRIYGTGDFEHVNYRYLEEPGRRVMVVDAVEKTWGPDYMRFGLGLSTDFTGDAYFNLLARYRKTWLNSLGAEWRTDLQFGRTTNLATEFYQPLNAENDFFIAPNLIVERRAATLYSGDQRIARYDVVASHVGLDLGYNIHQYGTLRLGLLGGTLEPKLDTGPPSLSPGPDKIDVGAYRARLFFDRLDSVTFPKKGWNAGLNVYDSNPGLGADSKYGKWDMDASTAHSFGNHTINLAVKAGGKIGADPLPNYDQFQWGGFLQQSGYKTGQLLGENITYGRAMYYHRILRGGLLEGAYGGFSLEVGRVGNPLVPGSPEGLLQSTSLFVAADTPLGPAYLGYGLAKGGYDSFYFYLGRPF